MFQLINTDYIQKKRYQELSSNFLTLIYQDSKLKIQTNQAIVVLVNHQKNMVCHPYDKDSFIMRESDLLLLHEQTYFEFSVPLYGAFEFDLYLFEEIYTRKELIDHLIKYPILTDFFTTSSQNFYLFFKHNESNKLALTLELLKLEEERSTAQLLAFMLLLTQLHETHYHYLSVFDSNMMPNNQAGAILSYMVTNCDSIDLPTAAAHFNYNPNYFSSLCKKLLNATFSEKLVQIRLEKAIYLLDSTDLKIMDIATSIGFNDFSYFHKSFKKRYGISPKKYQKADKLAKESFTDIM
ncbi:hypothetical protein BAU15_13200 [Enterococcus sp. JM4C]|uniref:helix-turn-helix transcriptional regulator n=1 Tax=Candidatus Enterococcus huntleyi TaxID=1857217 RepID=UPI00137B5926|nr:helix-turn-helix transcriptional regulator [Enterococcus sp. JM4C]KAF1297716.1 hypothetical protein BAU15_13200 [Enterococcus sp. JM4C]